MCEAMLPLQNTKSKATTGLELFSVLCRSPRGSPVVRDGGSLRGHGDGFGLAPAAMPFIPHKCAQTILQMHLHSALAARLDACRREFSWKPAGF